MLLPNPNSGNQDAKLNLAEVRREALRDSAQADAARRRFLANELRGEQQTAADTRRALGKRRA